MASAASYLSRAPNNSLADASNEVRHLRVRTPRRKFVLASAAVGVAGALAWPLTARFSIRTIRSWCRLKFRSRRLPDAWDGITPQLSDFHYDDRFSVVPLRKAIDVVNRLRPNSLVLTEDLCSSSLQEIST